MTNDKPFPELLADVQSEVSQLRTKLNENIPCDATTLEPKLQAMLHALPHLPHEVGLANQQAIDNLKQELGELAEGFARVKSAIQKEMQTINDRMKAATAYAQSTANDKR